MAIQYCIVLHYCILFKNHTLSCMLSKSTDRRLSGVCWGMMGNRDINEWMWMNNLQDVRKKSEGSCQWHTKVGKTFQECVGLNVVVLCVRLTQLHLKGRGRCMMGNIGPESKWHTVHRRHSTQFFIFSTLSIWVIFKYCFIYKTK